MALHGEIKVNGTIIGNWSAQRSHWPRADGYFHYRTELTLNGKTHCGDVWHRYEDGAALLASKVLATAGVPDVRR